MGLKFMQGAGSFAPGVFINKVQISEIKDVSGICDPFGNTYDISLEIKLDIGKDFQPTFRVKGNLEYDPISHQPKSFGTARSVGDFFQQLGITLELDENNRVPAEMIAAAIGKEFFRLQYVSAVKDDGKLKYSDFNKVVGGEKTQAELYKIFVAGLAKEKPYPNNFHPEVLESGNGHGQPADTTNPPSAIPSALF